MKALFEYNVSTGEIADANGQCIYLSGMQPFESETMNREVKKSDNIEDMIRLRNAGFTANDIIEMKKAEIV